jgi:hypothetical protein
MLHKKFSEILVLTALLLAVVSLAHSQADTDEQLEGHVNRKRKGRPSCFHSKDRSVELTPIRQSKNPPLCWPQRFDDGDELTATPMLTLT